MQELGRGWQYTAYDLGNGRVLKRYNSLLRGYTVIFFDCLKFRPLDIFKIPVYFYHCKRQAKASLRQVARGKLEAWMMGNPKILNQLDYEQDLLVPLHELINAADPARGKKLVDDFVAFNQELLKRSLIDKSFNINKNFGLDAEGRVVLMDLGELYVDQAAIDERRRRRSWASPYIMSFITNEETRRYYVEEMDRHFAL